MCCGRKSHSSALTCDDPDSDLAKLRGAKRRTRPTTTAPSLHGLVSVFYYENKGKFVRGLPRTQVLSLFSKRAIRSQSTSVMTVEIMIDTPPSVSERGLPPGRLKKVEQRTRAAK